MMLLWGWSSRTRNKQAFYSHGTEHQSRTTSAAGKIRLVVVGDIESEIVLTGRIPIFTYCIQLESAL